MLNGDVLTDIDLTAQLRQHELTGARVTLGLIGVDDPSPYGLVRRREDFSVTEFVEKPGPDQVDTNLISLGAYIVEREVLSELPSAGTRVSIERDVFPSLVDRGLYGFQAAGYWLDIGTPDRYMQATVDILEGEVETEVGGLVRAAAGGTLREGDASGVAGTVHGPALVGSGSRLAPDAVIGARTVLGSGVTVQAGARIDASVLLDGCTVGAGARISDAIVGRGVTIGEHCHIGQHAILGEGVTIGAHNTLMAGVRIFPGVNLPDRAIAF